ncbi:hypothetical protein AB205_0061140 [Aquarana catesbeiana]|uniref:Uncharacterized protein n=1 Tax=Aquarana catesbeiana TaxID=8400 RepID=A0A2G9RRT3_AQUCT|nr:hypothetical protein AB205_0061140 [Aquarana catesbeiana]
MDAAAGLVSEPARVPPWKAAFRGGAPDEEEEPGAQAGHPRKHPCTEQVLWIIHSEILRWVLMSLAMSLSGAVLMLTFWPAVREDNRKVAISTLVAIMVLHVLLAVGCGEYFFDQPQIDLTAHPVMSVVRTTTGEVQSH